MGKFGQPKKIGFWLIHDSFCNKPKPNPFWKNILCLLNYKFERLGGFQLKKVALSVNKSLPNAKSVFKRKKK